MFNESLAMERALKQFSYISASLFSWQAEGVVKS
jgi:hypothetical protein